MKIKLINNALFSMVKPILPFIAIYPGYQQRIVDISWTFHRKFYLPLASRLAKKLINNNYNSNVQNS
jgi:hypothetical protein